MNLSLKQKLGVGALVLTALYLLSDIVLELLFEGLEVTFEAVEYVFDAIIEHLFDASRHTAQVVTFYLLFLIAAAYLYRLSRRLPSWYRALKADWIDVQHQFDAVTHDYWHAASAYDRMKWGSAITIGVIALIWGLLL
jgi:predicted PurR-regulated permease PerM